jgi:hypothetical protein
MVLRSDERQWMIYDPNTVDMVFKALEAAALVHLGAALQRRAGKLPAALAENIGNIGVALWKFGDARQQIQAGLAPNDVPDQLVHAQRGWDEFNKWLEDPTSVPIERVAQAVDEIAGAIVYMDQRIYETGTNHPRWNSRLVSGQPCNECGR